MTATKSQSQKRKGKQSNGNAMNPLPSLLRASAWDAANRQMREAGRTKWSEDDYNLACSEQERLIRACYGRPGDNQPELCYIRFQIAEVWQKAGDIHLDDDWAEVLEDIEAAIVGEG